MLNKMKMSILILVFLLMLLGCEKQVETKEKVVETEPYNCSNAETITFIDVYEMGSDCEATCKIWYCHKYNGTDYAREGSGRMGTDSYGRRRYETTCDCHCYGTGINGKRSECVYKTGATMFGVYLPDYNYLAQIRR